MEETRQTDGELQFKIENGNDLPTGEIATRQFEVAGFWRRISAFFIDVVILAIPFIILGFVFRDLAFSLGPWGRIIGYGIALLYWGFFNSTFENGQTVGKKIMKIAVVDRTGDYLSLEKAMSRALVLAPIGLLNGWAAPFMKTPIMVYVGNAVVWGGALALLYGFIINRRTQQGIHDLIVGSYVVKAPPQRAIAPETPSIHIGITYGLVGLGAILSLTSLFLQRNVSTLGILEPGEWEQLQELQTTLSDNDEFFSVGVQLSHQRQSSSSQVMRTLNIQIWAKRSCIREPEYCDEVMEQTARTALEQYAGINKLTGMRIVITNAFDLGLATGSLYRSGAWSIEDWRKQLAQ